jgi:hypothetical protein
MNLLVRPARPLDYEWTLRFRTPPMVDELAWEIMNATADDWESLDQIAPGVDRYRGPVERLAVARTLASLVDRGLMEVACPNGDGDISHVDGPHIEPEAVIIAPAEYWFRMSRRGREVWAANIPDDVDEAAQ